MEDIVKEFLDEVNDIKNSSLFMEDDENEPTTEWVEEIDSRTNFPFYWNSNTKESVWDKPEAYETYLNDYECYLRGIVEQHCIKKAQEVHENDLKKKSDMRDLLGYSDSEEECDKECEGKEITDEVVTLLEPTEPEENPISKKERWMGEQAVLATQYLHSIIKSMTETAVMKVQALSKEFPNGESMIPIVLQVQTRLEDWEGGYLTIERTVDKLKDALVAISKFEGDLEFNNWKLLWNGEKAKYYFENVQSGEKKWTLSTGTCNHEDGEIVEDEDDLASDLHEYVTSTLQPSLLDQHAVSRQTDSVPVSNDETVDIERLLEDGTVTVMEVKEEIPREDKDVNWKEGVEILGLEEMGLLADKEGVETVKESAEESTISDVDKMTTDERRSIIVGDVEEEGFKEKDLEEDKSSDEKALPTSVDECLMIDEDEDKTVEDGESDECNVSEDSDIDRVESECEDAEGDVRENSREEVVVNEVVMEEILEKMNQDMNEIEEEVEDSVEEFMIECAKEDSVSIVEDDTEELMLKYAKEFKKEEASRRTKKDEVEEVTTNCSSKFMALVDYGEEEISDDCDGGSDL